MQFNQYKSPMQHRRTAFIGLLLLSICPHSTGVFGQERPAFSEQILNGNSAGFLRLDTGKIALPEKLKNAEQQTQSPISDMAKSVQQGLDRLRELSLGQPIYVSMDMGDSSSFLLQATTASNVPASNLKELADAINLNAEFIDRSNPRATQVAFRINAPSSTHSSGGAMTGSEIAAWRESLDATKEFPIQCVLRLPEDIRKTLTEIKPDLPQSLGGGPSDWLLEGVRWVSIGVDTEKAKLKVIVQSPTEESARVLKDKLPAAFHKLAAAIASGSHTKLDLLPYGDLLHLDTVGSQVVVSSDINVVDDRVSQLVANLLGFGLDPILIKSSSNKLKEITLGLHNYVSEFKVFPTYYDMAKSKQRSGLSWRVHILPFVGEQKLYEKFRLDEAWDSPHNLALLAEMPEVYSPSSAPAAGVKPKAYHTTFVAPIGKNTAFGQDEPLSFQGITDGTSNTIAFVELKIEYAIPWTSPEEYVFDESAPASRLRDYNGKTPVANFDGSVLEASLDWPRETWLAKFSRNGGEPVK